jgi:hypothetical protein
MNSKYFHSFLYGSVFVVSVVVGAGLFASGLATSPSAISRTQGASVGTASSTTTHTLTLTTQSGGTVSAQSLTATPDTGYDFVGWNGACGGTGPCQVDINADPNVSAQFALKNFTISITATGTGTVTGSGISCPGATCNKTDVYGSTQTFTATPGSGYIFAGWGGACSGTSSCTFTLGADTFVTATFVPLPKYTVTVTIDGSGSVTAPTAFSCTTTCTKTHTQGTTVTFTAVPGTNQMFTGWDGICTSATSTTCTYKYTAAGTLTAHFAPIMHALQTTVTGSGTVTGTNYSCTTNCATTYTQGTSMTLTATPTSGQAFTGWGGACSGTGTCTIAMDSPKSVTATFEKVCMYPSEVLNLTNWKVTVPAGAQESPTEVKQPVLATYALSPYFSLKNGCNNGVQFRAPVNSVTTSGSSYPRSELREMTNNGLSSASWSPTVGTHTMFIDEAVTAVPQTKKHVVVGQIHDANDDVVVIRLQYPILFIDVNGVKGKTLDSNYTLGKRFTVKFEAGGGKVKIYYNGATTPIQTINSTSTGDYFKAGTYTQSNCSTEVAGSCASDNYGENVIYNLWVTHQ